MLADEMTTGSITSTDAQKRVFAARSHEWNLKENGRFKEAFPEVRSLSLPVFCGEKEGADERFGVVLHTPSKGPTQHGRARAGARPSLLPTPFLLRS